MKAKAYDNSQIKFLGEVLLDFSYKNKSVQHKFLVIGDDNVCLLGRDLCLKLKIKLKMPSGNIFSIKNNILEKYDEFLGEKSVSCVQKRVKFHMKENVDPVFIKARTVPIRYRKLVREELSRLENAGIISKVLSSEWCSPTVNVMKSNNKIRICGDYSQTINKYMTMARHPLPSIDDVCYTVGNAKYFTKIDLQNAFLQLPLDEESKKYTTINTSEGMYVYNFLPYGTCSSPGIFRSFLCNILSGIKSVIIYQDDILIMTETTNQHDLILDKVLNALRNAGLKINRDKSEFFTNEINYLGHVFDKNGVRMDSEKIRAILKAPKPTNIKQVQSFIGLCNYYNRFIINFSEVFAPLYKLLKKNSTFEWNSEQNKCFEIIKKLFTTNLVLKSFDLNLETALETDASSVGIGAVLMQKHDNNWLPVQFVSRSLNSAERSYSQIEREALSVIFGCEKFKKFLLGSEFLLKNDHKPLKKLFANDALVPTTCSARLQRWALRLSQFKYVFEYIKGEENVNSDFLSRLPLNETVQSQEPNEVIFVISSLNDMPVTCNDIITETNNDEYLLKLKQYIRSGFPSILDAKLSEFSNVIDDLSISKDCIMFQNRVYVPKKLRNHVLKQFHEHHPGISAMRQLARALIWYPGLDKDIINYVKSCKNCQDNQSKPSQNSNVAWPKATTRWSRLHIDHFFYEDKIFFVLIDSFSKYIECSIVQNVSSNCTIEFLREIFARNGLPETIVSDNSTSFVSTEFKEFLENNKIIHITSPAYHPSSNGQGENSVRIIKQLLKKNNKGSMRTRLSHALFHHRSVPHSVTKVAPSVLLNNRKFITLKDRINPLHLPSISRDKIDKNVRKFEVGENVLVLNSRPGPKWFRGVVTEKLGINVYNVHVFEFDSVWCRHANQIKSTIINESNVLPIDDFESNVLPIVDVEMDVSNNMCPDSLNTNDSNISNNDSTPTENVSISDNQPDLPRRSIRVPKPIDRLNL